MDPLCHVVSWSRAWNTNAMFTSPRLVGLQGYLQIFQRRTVLSHIGAFQLPHRCRDHNSSNSRNHQIAATCSKQSTSISYLHGRNLVSTKLRLCNLLNEQPLANTHVVSLSPVSSAWKFYTTLVTFTVSNQPLTVRDDQWLIRSQSPRC